MILDVILIIAVLWLVREVRSLKDDTAHAVYLLETMEEK